MDIKDQLNKISNKLDSIDSKLDAHLERISKAEEAILWIRGHLRVSTTIFLAISGTLALWWFNLINK